MNMIEYTPSHWMERWNIKTAIPVVLLGLLSACADETAGPTSSPIDVQSTARPSVSAAELSNDGVNSVSFAQAVAAGVVDKPFANNSGEPAFGAANPDVSNPNPVNIGNGNSLAAIPTSNSVNSTLSSSSALGAFTVRAETTPTVTETPIQTPESLATPAPVTEAVSELPAPSVITEPEAITASIPEPVINPEAETITETEPSSSGAGSVGNGNTLQFSSSTTPGFVGEVLDDAIRISWTADPAARGYNVYKQAKYITTVFGSEFIDEDVFDSDYYYEIQAFDYSDKLYYIATGLTVSARTLGRTDPDAVAPNAGLLQDYQLVFSDEFNGSQLDASKWNTSYLWGTDLIINSEEQYYVDILKEPNFGYNPFTFDGNNLTINSIRTPDQLSSKALNQPYLSGVITSYDAFKFTYGYIETRAKVSYGRGYWPAFWLLNAYYVDDKPEIDIMEFIGHNQDVVYHTYHYYDSAGELRSTKSMPTPGIDYTSDFHTYAAEWKPGTIIFYIDGIERHRINDAKVSRQDMYVIANTALGGWWAGSPDNTTSFPGEYTLDYIRVYQKTTPFDDNVLFNDGITSVPYADDIPGAASPNHRPSKADWPAGYPDGL